MTFDLSLTLSTPWMQVRLGTMVCKFGRDPATYLVEEAIAQNVCRLTDRRTDGRTDRQTTDDGRRTIALAHGMS